MSKCANKSFQQAEVLPRNWHSLAHAFLIQARQNPDTPALIDSLGAELTYMQLLIRSVALANLLRAKLDSSPCVGILIPPSAGAVIANLALTLLGKVTVNLNYSAGQAAFDSYVEDCNLHHIVTSGHVLDRIPIKTSVALIKLEEVQEQVQFVDKIKAFVESEIAPELFLQYLLPGLQSTGESELRHLLCSPAEAEISSTDKHSALGTERASMLSLPASVIFTSGSTGSPKGVLLSHRNILSNIHAIRMQGHVKRGERILGIIPFFHSFGFTMTLWGPLCLGETVIYHFDPLDARRIASLCQATRATCMICTPTMFSNILRRSGHEPFSSLRTCILGGERVKSKQFETIKESLGITPLVGYGLTETSPVVACNVEGEVTLPDGRTVDGTRYGTVGLPLSGTEIRIVDVESGRELAKGEEGLIQVKGPQVMLGYLKQPRATAQALSDGWFNTGDVGMLDADGFLKITDRLSEFSKICGEMVSHSVVEEELLKILDSTNSDCLAVTSVPDEKRGERLVVLLANQVKSPRWIVTQLNKTGLPKLWIPNRNDFIIVDRLPVLANGKIDRQRIKQLAKRP